MQAEATGKHLTIANNPSDGTIERAMRKTRLYLDTSPIIRVGDGESPIRQAITKEFFRVVGEKSDEYELFISPVTLEELRDGPPEKIEEAILFLKTLEHTELLADTVAENLARIYAIDGVLSQSHINDLRHVAFAVVSRGDYIITWNMKHLANEKTVSRVNMVNGRENYGKIFIATPEFFTGGTVYGR